MTSPSDRTGALEAIERILNRGGNADNVVREVVGVLHERFGFAAIRFVEGDHLVDGPSAGQAHGTISKHVEFQGRHVADLAIATDDEALVRRIATIISPYCLVGWDTGGKPWFP